MVADPGSMAAIEQGCTCPRMDNADLRGTGLFVFRGDCPLHGEATWLSSSTATRPSEPLTVLDSAERTTESGACCASEQVGYTLSEFASLIGINLPESDSLVSADDSEDVESCVFDVPLEHQQDMLDNFLVLGRSYLLKFLYRNWPEIRRMARKRHKDGYATYGSRMYSWDAETRRRNALEELADALVYMSSGDYGSSSHSGGKVE